MLQIIMWKTKTLCYLEISHTSVKIPSHINNMKKHEAID